MMSMGRAGYLDSCKQIVGAARKIEERVAAEIPELEVLGKPQVTVVAFKSDTVDVYEVGDKMSERGWHRESFANRRLTTKTDTFTSSERPAEPACFAHLLYPPNGAGSRRLHTGPQVSCRGGQVHPSRARTRLHDPDLRTREEQCVRSLHSQRVCKAVSGCYLRCIRARERLHARLLRIYKD